MWTLPDDGDNNYDGDNDNHFGNNENDNFDENGNDDDDNYDDDASDVLPGVWRGRVSKDPWVPRKSNLHLQGLKKIVN